MYPSIAFVLLLFLYRFQEVKILIMIAWEE